MAGPDKLQQKPKKLLQAWLVYPQLISNILLFDGIAIVAVCCQSMSILQYACNSTEASAPLVLHLSGSGQSKIPCSYCTQCFPKVCLDLRQEEEGE